MRFRNPGRQFFALMIVFMTVAAGCESEAEPSEAPTQPQPVFETSDDPLAQIPREELYGASPVENLWSPRYELEVLDLPQGWNGARFAILSDFQLGLWDENEQVAAAAVQKAIEANPDVILLLGDYIARGDDTTALDRVLAPLRGKTVIGVLGDRDIRTDSIAARITASLTANGVKVLKNNATPVQRNGESIFIGGLDPDIVSEGWDTQQYLLAIIGEPGLTPILLTHLAPMITRAPMRRYPITIAGNTFCGNVEVPGTPRISWLSKEAFPNGEIEGTGRLFRVQGSTVLVTCGIGYGFIPVRFGAAPEVPILTLTRLGSTVPGTNADSMPQDTVLQRYLDQASDTTTATTPPR
jgi:uncharacterized protein